MVVVEADARRLVAFIHSLKKFSLEPPEVPFQHMGATITDAILQAGVRYDTVVRPRVRRLRARYPELRTTSAFLRLLEAEGPAEIIEWTHPEKLQRILRVAHFFAKEGIETEGDLARWLAMENNCDRLKELRGIGNKTSDYFKILAGMSTTAIDRRLIEFLGRAGIEASVCDYDRAHKIISRAAEIMRVDLATLDHSLWRYVARNSAKEGCQ
jgi:hypothetical protein